MFLTVRVAPVATLKILVASLPLISIVAPPVNRHVSCDGWQRSFVRIEGYLAGHTKGDGPARAGATLASIQLLAQLRCKSGIAEIGHDLIGGLHRT